MQNSSSSYFTSCGKIDSAFKLSGCKQESECKFAMSAGAGVTVLGKGAGVKKVTPITSASWHQSTRGGTGSGVPESTPAGFCVFLSDPESKIWVTFPFQH